LFVTSFPGNIVNAFSKLGQNCGSALLNAYSKKSVLPNRFWPLILKNPLVEILKMVAVNFPRMRWET